MSMRSWIRSLFTRPATRPIRKAPRRARLTLEALEDRWLPSAVTVGNLTDCVNGDTCSIAALISNPGEDGISLREAVAAANNTAGADAIDFAVSGTITLGGTQLELTDKTGATTITGPGVTVNGGKLSRVLQVDDMVTALISGLTISGGKVAGTSGNGGGLSNFGNTTLSNCTLSGNSAGVLGGSVYAYGGAVYGAAGSTTTLNDCTVSGNSAVIGGGLSSQGNLALNRCTVNKNSADHGGAVENELGTTTLTDCTVSGNTSTVSGGGLALYGGTTTLTNCTVSDNSGLRGGGLWAMNATVQLVDSTVSGNTTTGGSGGGVYNHSSNVTLQNCTISGNSAVRFGGGVFNLGTTTLTGCTLSGNSAGLWGGGVGTNGGPSQVTLTNCTVAGNSAPKGGGLWISGTAGASAILVNCTVSGNSATSGDGGGIGRSPSGSVTLGNTIVAGNTATGSGPDVYGAVVSQGFNLIGKTNGSSGWVSTDLKGTTTAPLNPLLAPLGFYGGLTQTMPLLPGSAAIDGGSNSLIPAGITTDQRGLTRTVNTTVDIGAFESSGFTITVVSGGGQSAVTGKAFLSPLVVKVTANNSLEPVAGGLVTFTTPTSGASAVLSCSTATIGADGKASVTATTNGSVGSYTVTATTRGILNSVIFTLTNKKKGT